MNNPLTENIQTDLDQAIAEILVNDLAQEIQSKQPGHRIQVTDLPAALMERVCQELRRRIPACQSFVLTNDRPREWEITASQLVARRNLDDAVVLVFFPPDLRTSAEDSLDVSTFARVPVGDLYKRLREQLEQTIPTKYRPLYDEIVREALYDSDVAICRYLLALKKVGVSRKTMGLALFHLGLIPDAALPDEPRPQLDSNKEVVRTLANPRASIIEKIQALGLKTGRTPNALYRLFSEVGNLDPIRWLPTILDHSFVDDLTFDRWEFARPRVGEIDQIIFKSIMPLHQEPDSDYPIFRLQQDQSLKIVWETVPPPLQCEGLSYFTVELMKDDAPATEARTVKVGTGRRKERSTTFKDLTKNDLEDGLYYVRVSAWGEGGRLIKDAKSESFLIESLPEDDDTRGEEEEPPRRSIVTSMYEAELRTQVKLRARDKDIEELNVTYKWITPERRVGGRYTDEFAIIYNTDNQYILPVNAVLRRLEEWTLEDADSLGRYEHDLTKARGAMVEPRLQAFEGIEFERLTKFLGIRRELFHRIINQPNHSGITFLVETANVLPLAGLIIEYAQAYRDALRFLQSELGAATGSQRQQLLAANRQLTSIDTVKLILADNTEAYLMAPTHPLKLLWVLQYARAARHWMEQIKTYPEKEVAWSTFDYFIPRLISLNVPNVLLDARGELLINADNLGPFWSIFVPATTRDVRAMVGRIKTALGSPEADERFTTITADDLVSKVLGYLDQHPYVSTLSVNAIQPGSGAILVQMLLALEKARPGLHYKLHLFASDFDPEELGAALDEMMSPIEKRSGSDELDTFVTPSENSLYPKLVYSKHRLNEFFDRPDDFEAHLTLLFDAFTVKVVFTPPLSVHRSNHLFGLLHQYASQFSTTEQVTWQRQIALRQGRDIDDEYPGHTTLVALLSTYAEIVTAQATGDSHTRLCPTIRLALGPEDKNLINQAHQISDWVLTVDPNFGIEYLDSPYDEHCPAYLIDYQPEYLGEVGHRLFVSTRYLYEVERIVQPVLQRFGLGDSAAETRELVNALRSVSGRLVLKLISSPQMASGALGIAVARLFLHAAGLLQDMVLIPLDSHLDLFTTARREAERLGQALSLRRTDMLLAEIEPENQQLTFHLIEVKWRTNAGTTALAALQDEISAQLENSAQIVRQLYDPEWRETDRIDRAVRTQELYKLLSFYLERAQRYQLVTPDRIEYLRSFLDNLERGYHLRHTRAGIILNLHEQGYRIEKDEETTFHIVGADAIRQLIAKAREFTDTGVEPETDTTFTETRSTFTKRGPNSIHKPIETDTELIDVIVPSAAVPPEIPIPLEEPSPFSPPSGKLACDVILGARHPTSQFGILGRAGNRTIALDLNGTNVISLFGVQGSGKSYTLGNILEMAVTPIPGINQLPAPLGAVVFHYSKTEDYKPEFASMTQPNTGADVDLLRQIYGAQAVGLSDILILAPEGKVAQRQKEFPGLPVRSIFFDTSELQLDDWKFLMGVVGGEQMYVRKMEQIFRRLRDNINLTALYSALAGSGLNDTQMDLARTRLHFAEEFIREGQFLRDHIQPGRLIIVDLRDALIEKEQALGLFVVMLKILANTRHQGQGFNKLMVFDEAHKYLGTSFVKEVEEVVREMRHKGTTVLIASQDPLSVPVSIIALSTQIILHKFNSPAWLQHIQKSNIALKDLGAGRLNMLNKGQAYVWSSDATDPDFTTRAVRVEIRPRVTKHGGSTVTAM